MKSAVLFDLGSTLIHYYDMSEFPEILQQGIAAVQHYLSREGLLRVPPEVVWRQVHDEDHEAQDHCVRPLEERLARIFQLEDLGQPSGLALAMCRRFMEPIFARAHCYDDVLPTLRELRSRGLRSAIVTNTPWGSPANLWQEEMDRFGLRPLVDAVVCCRDVGWRKPAQPIFEFTLRTLRLAPQDCLFVGDHPRWDLAGPRAVGIEAILLDRRGDIADPTANPIRGLRELWERL